MCMIYVCVSLWGQFFWARSALEIPPTPELHPAPSGGSGGEERAFPEAGTTSPGRVVKHCQQYGLCD